MSTQFKTENEARSEAAAVKRSLHTRGWKIHVHQNMGWYFFLSNLDGHLTLYQSDHDGDKCYWTLFSLTGQFCGDPHFTDKFHSHNPNYAIDHQMDRVDQYFKDIDVLRQQFEKLNSELK